MTRTGDDAADCGEPGESEAWSRLIVDGARDYAILTTDPAGTITSWSPGAEAVFGWSAEVALGRDVAMTFTAEDRAAGRPAEERAVARADGSAPDVRWHLRRDGGRIFIEGVTRLLTDETGGARGFVKIGQDVTRRRAVEAALGESEARFRTLAAVVPALLWSTEADGDELSLNQRWLEYTGQTAEETRNGGWLAAIHPDDREATRRAFARAYEREEALEVEYRIRSADGVFRWFLVRQLPLRGDEGRITRWFAAAVDIEDRRRAEAALRELNESLEQRVTERTAQLARTNRALVEEVRQRREAEATRREVLRQLVTAQEDERRRMSRELHDSMGQLVTGLLLGLRALDVVGRPAADAARIRGLAELADRVARELQHLAVELRPPALDNLGLAPAMQNHLEEWSRRFDVAYDFHEAGLDGRRLPPEVETTVYRVIQEALNNVAKHAAATRVGLVLERRGGRLIAVLEDDGRGFAVDATLASPEKANRLGLRGMRERVSLVGGELEVESAPGSGTTLYVRLPLAADTGEEVGR